MLSATLISFIALGLLSGVHADRALSLALSGPAEVQDVDNFAIVAKITNTGSEAVRLYKDPRSAIDDFPTNTFTVTSRDGDATEFIGATVKWNYKAANDFITLAPGESREVTHQLGDAYNFTKTGTYSITPQATFLAVPDGRTPYPIPIVASVPDAKFTATLSGNLISSVVDKRNREIADSLDARSLESLEKRATFSGGCNAAQQAAINTAALNAVSYTSGAILYLSRAIMGARYKKWFGTYTPARKNLVLSHYQKILSSDPRKYQYDCSCTRSGVFAYVYPNAFGIIYLCPVFWSAPALGTDSKAGTIVHESSHFTANGGTRDWAYGQTNAGALAISNPDQAVMNADSHEYFAENTPYLS